MRRTLLGIVMILLATPLQAGDPKTKPLNVLFIIADDLRVELGCYGSPALTPNIDALAKQGILFERAYCQQALCNPSRSSLLTGKRPDTLHLWMNGTHFRDRQPDVMTLPLHFKHNGYTTRNVGKIFHNWHTKEKGDRRSWSAAEFLHYAQHSDDLPLVKGDQPVNLARAPRCECCDVGDEAYFDGRVAAEAVKVLAEIKDQPFFLAVGFWKPHAPFNAPKKYWDLYDRSKLPRLNRNRPKDAPEIAFHDGRELRGIPPKQVTFSAEEAAEIRHGYFANISYMDAMVGKVVQALDKHGLRENTLVIFTGDHGYHIGEHDLWAKTSNFEWDAHVPLIFSPPKSSKAGSKSSALVELLDLFPTLVDLAGLPAVKGLEGMSLRPIIEDPAKHLKKGAFTQHPRPAYFDRTEKGIPDAMGYSVRTDRVRYTEWRDWKSGEIVARELYDHLADKGEMVNVIQRPPDEKALQAARAELHRMFPPDIAPSRR